MNFNIQILGSNSALPSYNKFSTSQVITVHSQPYLIDCGEGTQMQMRRFKTKYGKINEIFISHLHGDHYFGLFGLLSSYNLTNREKKLTIYADEKLQKMLTSDLSPVNINTLSFEVEFIALPKTNGKIYENTNLEIHAFQLNHRINAWGFLFLEKKKDKKMKKEAIQRYNLSIEDIKKIKKGANFTYNDTIIENTSLTIEPFPPRSYAFCSDTIFFPEITSQIKNVTLLYHEATYCNKDEQKAKKFYHSTAQQAAKIATIAEAKNLLIGHLSTKITNPYECLSEAKEIFKRTILSTDGLNIEITTNHELIIN